MRDPNYLDRLRDDDGGEEGDQHWDNPLVGHVVAKLEAVGQDDEGAAEDGEDANDPADDSAERGPTFVTSDTFKRHTMSFILLERLLQKVVKQNVFEHLI